MPIYEFYCPDCHMIFNFFSRKVNTTKIPNCPRCGREKLERRFSVFSIRKGGIKKEEEGEEFPDLNIDEQKLEQVIEKMGKEVDKIDEENPAQAAGFLRRFFEEVGLKPGPGMEEAIRRMESGEDPEKIEEELGDVLENEEDLFQVKDLKKSIKDLKKKLTPPAVDEKLYDL